MEIISSHDIEDTYLTSIVAISKLLRLSTKIEMKFVKAQHKHFYLANRKFDNTTKKDLFKKAYWFQNHRTKIDTTDFRNFVIKNKGIWI